MDSIISSSAAGTPTSKKRRKYLTELFEKEDTPIVIETGDSNTQRDGK